MSALKKNGKNQKIPMQQIRCKKIKTMKEKKIRFLVLSSAILAKN